MEYDLAIAVATILSAIATITIASWAVMTSRSAKTQAEASESQAQTSKLQAEASKIQAELALTEIQLMQHESNQSLRPWIGIIEFTKTANSEVIVGYKNFGKIPNQSMQCRLLVRKEMIDLDELKKDIPTVKYMGIIFPQQTKKLRTHITKKMVTNATENSPLYIGIRLMYEYDGNKGEFSCVVKFDGKIFPILHEEFI